MPWKANKWVKSFFLFQTSVHHLQDAVFVPAPEKTEPSEPVYFLSEKPSESSEPPVYFLTGDPDSLHADRSPYTFEPASQGPAANVNAKETVKKIDYQKLHSHLFQAGSQPRSAPFCCCRVERGLCDQAAHLPDVPQLPNLLHPHPGPEKCCFASV